jgi:hypothetical protein
MIDGGNGLTSWLDVWLNKLTMFGPIAPLIRLIS